MTGRDAWSLISPIIAGHMIPYKDGGKNKLDALDEAYVVTYCALLDFDEKGEKHGKKDEK